MKSLTLFWLLTLLSGLLPDLFINLFLSVDITTMLADRRKNSSGKPKLELLSTLHLASEYQAIETGLIDQELV